MKLNISLILVLTTMLAYGATSSQSQAVSAEVSVSYEKHPYLEMIHLLNAAISAEEDIHDNVEGKLNKRISKIKSMTNISKEEKAIKENEVRKLMEYILPYSLKTINSLLMFKDKLRKIDSDKTMQNFVSILLEARLHNLYSRRKNLLENVYFPETSPSYVFSDRSPEENECNEIIAKNTVMIYKILTELCIIALKTIPKDQLNDVNRGLLQCSPSLLRIFNGGDITHPDDVIKRTGRNTVDDSLRLENDVFLYEYYFVSSNYLSYMAIPFDNEIIDSLPMTPNQKIYLMNEKKKLRREKNRLCFQTKGYPLLCSYIYIDSEIRAMEELEKKNGKYDKDLYKQYKEVDIVTLKTACDIAPLPSIDGVMWDAFTPFMSFNDAMKIIYPPKIEQKPEVKVVPNLKHKKTLRSQNQSFPTSKDTSIELNPIVPEVSVVHEEEQSMQTAVVKDDDIDVEIKDVRPEPAYQVTTPLTKPLVKPLAKLPIERDRQADAFESIINLLKNTKVLPYKHFKSAWESIGGKLESQGKGGSHKRMIYENRYVGCAVKLHKGQDGYGPKSRKYFLEDIIAHILPKRLSTLLS